MNPRLKAIAFDGMHRLIPSLYSEKGTVLAEIAPTEALLRDAILLDGATNDRIQGEEHGLMGISTYELIYGVPHAHIVNAAFTHTSDSGGRFNDHMRGAWYAAVALETSVAEVTYHKARRLADIVAPGLAGERPDGDVSTYDDWLADFRGGFHLLDPPKEFADCLKAEPVPACYAAPQALARQLLGEQSNGLLYPSVRHAGGTCLVCFRPALVYSPRREERLEIAFSASKDGYAHKVRAVPIQ
jgi:RES domain-containing protein